MNKCYYWLICNKYNDNSLKCNYFNNSNNETCETFDLLEKFIDDIYNSYQ